MNKIGRYIWGGAIVGLIISLYVLYILTENFCTGSGVGGSGVVCPNDLAAHINGLMRAPVYIPIVVILLNIGVFALVGWMYGKFRIRRINTL